MNDQLAMAIMGTVKALLLHARVIHKISAAIETCQMSLDYATN